MKNKLLYIFIGIVLGGVFLGSASVAHAQLSTDPTERTKQIKQIADTAGITEEQVKTDIEGNPGFESYYTSSYLLPPSEEDKKVTADRAAAEKERVDREKAAAEKNKVDPEKEYGCNWPWNVKACYIEPLANVALWLSSRLLWIAGILLNMSIHYTLNMSTLLDSLPIVDIGWTIIRDIANIVFIFIALWSGISITLGIRAEKAWGLLANMVLVALFINFSLFITKAVVDASNVAALHFYSLIKQPGSTAYDGGLSNAFMSGLNVQSLYNASQLGALTEEDKSYVKTVGKGNAYSTVNLILIGVFGSFFMVVAAWVFFAAAIMFIIRAVVLIMLMILSPLAFVGLILPGASGMAHEWWHKLWSQSFFAPLYLALAYVVVATINSPAFKGIAVAGAGPTSFAAAFTGFNSASVLIVLNFVILIGFMVACLVVAQSMGAKGSEMAMAGWKKIQGESVSFMGRTAMRGFGLGAIGEHLQERNAERRMRGERVGLLSRIGAGALKYTSVRNLDERLGQTKWGNRGVVKFLREQTLGQLRHAKFGGAKSAEEAYEESERDASVRRKIGYLAQARQAGVSLQRLRGQQGARYAQRFAAQRTLAQAQAQVSQAMTPQVSAQQQAQITAAEQARNTAQQNLTQAQATPGVTPQVLQQLQQNVAQAEQNLLQQQAPRWTPAQQQTQTAMAALAQAEQNLAANPNDSALIQARDVAQDQLSQVSPAHRDLADAQAAYERADAGVNQFNSDYGQQIAEYTKQMSQFLAKLSPKEFVEYMPKPEFFNPALMNMEVLPTSFIDALMKDEHALTEPEKDAAYLARQHDVIEVSKRGEERWAWYHDAVQRYQRASNARNSAGARMEHQLTLPNGVTLRAELTNLEGLQEQLARERDLPLNQQNAQLVQTLEQDINARKQALRPLEQQRETQLEQMMRSGELERPEMPEQPGWDEAPELRRALRNMRGLTEITQWYQHGRESLNLKLLAQTIMQGVWSDVRKSELFDSAFKEEIGRGRKREYVLSSGDLTMGFDPNVTDAISKYQGFAMNELRKHANKRLTEQGPETFFRTWNDRSWTDSDGEAHDDPQSIAERYQQLITNHNAQHPQETVADAVSEQERLDIRFNAGMTMYDQVSPNLASEEFTLMRGLERDLYAVMRNMEVSQLRHYANRDLDVKIPMVEFFLKQFRDEVLGIRKMTRENLQNFTWFVNQGGQDFTAWEKIKPELRDYWEQVKSIIGREDARTPGSIYQRLRTYAQQGRADEAPVIQRMNEIRRTERVRLHLPPMVAINASTQPFSRIGAKA